jgi:hypothetical protein
LASCNSWRDSSHPGALALTSVSARADDRSTGMAQTQQHSRTRVLHSHSRWGFIIHLLMKAPSREAHGRLRPADTLIPRLESPGLSVLCRV